MHDNTKQPPTLGYESRSNRRRSSPRTVLIIIGWAIIVSILIFSLLPIIKQRSYDIPPRVKCASNMHQIALAIIMYANDHGQNYPNSLPELLEEQITAAPFVCPGSNDTPSTAPTTQAIAADWAAGGHESYIYVGKGLTEKTATATTVVLYESMTNHGDGMNVLFGDGHVDWIDATVGKKVITAAAGRLPILLNEKTGVVSTSQPMR